MNGTARGATLLGVALVCGTAAAQQGQLIQVTRVQVKPDRVAEYIDIQKQLNEGAQKAGSPTGVTAYRGVGGNPFEFVFITLASSYGDFDDLPAWVKAMPVEMRTRGTALFARRNQCVDAVRVTYERGIPDLSIGTAATPPPKLIRAVRVHLKPGAAEGFIALVKSDMMPALKKANISWSRARRVEYGGSRNDLTVSAGIDKLAELDTDLLVHVLGPDGAKKYLEKASQFVNGAEYLVYRRLADLSYAGKQQ